METESKPNYWWSMFTFKCPRCRRGEMFTYKNPWKLKETLTMPKTCSECNQPFELEVGFWWGTSYISYAITVLMCMASFVAWWLLVGISTEDNRFFWWIAVNAVSLIILQPWIMRFSRVVYLYIFIHYDKNYKDNEVKTFDYDTGDYLEK